MDIKEKILQNKEEMIEKLTKLVSYNSVLNEPCGENAPYGKETALCLEEALSMAKEYGFETKNLDGHCGYAQIGNGREIIGILAHLDIVPAGNGWDSDPFVATIRDNKIYGRGTSDDKGGTIASMFALKLIKESGIELNKRIRLILGCNEETGSNCIKHYIEKEGNVDVGFTPDADFPVIHGEKGQIKAIFKCKNGGTFRINGGVVENAVSDNCTVEIGKEEYNKELLEEYFKANNIEYFIESNQNKDIIKVKGLASHACRPHLGINAISHAILALKNAGVSNNLVDFYSKYIGLETDGDSLGIKCEDKYGTLTCTNGKIWTEDNEIIGSLDIRIPVSLDNNEIEKILTSIDCNETEMIVKTNRKGLFYPEDSKLIQTFMKVYREVTGDKNAKPITIGGGTYAKEMKNCVAFGCAFPNTNNRIHDANEFVDIDELLLQVELYYNAILELIKL